MYVVRKVRIWQLLRLHKVSTILYRCGKDMAQKSDLHHWDNSWLKNAVIVFLCALKNTIYLVYDGEGKAVATFQTRKEGENFRFQKLATDPSYAGKGVGSFCIETIETLAKEARCDKVCLEVYEKSEHATSFYKHRGYKVTGTANTLKYTELKMEKALTVATTPKKVLIVGAGFLQSFVIQKAKKMGYTTLAVDADANAVGFQYADKSAVINIVDKEACLAYAVKEKIDGVLTAATDYGVLTAAYVAEQMGLPGLHYETAKKIKNKYEIRKCLFENNVDDTEQAYEVTCDTALEKLKKELHYPVMIKPCDGSGSRGANRVDDADGVDEACKLAMDTSITHRAEIETFICGQEYGAESLVVDGRVHVLGIMKKWMTQPPFYAELGHAIPSGLPSELEERAKQCVENAIRALGINFGSVNMDLLITLDKKIYIVDIGARMGGNMIGPCVIPYGTGIDYMAAMIRNAVGDDVQLNAKGASAVATRLLAFGQEGVVEHLPDFQALEQEYDVEIYHHMSLGQKVNVYHTNLDGCGYIVAKGSDVENASQRADAVLQKIKNCIFS